MSRRASHHGVALAVPSLVQAFNCPHCARNRCQMKFGTFFSKERTAQAMRAASYLTVWLGTHSKTHGYHFNPYWHGRMLERARAHNSTAVYYSYVIAMLARHTKGIKDW